MRRRIITIGLGVLLVVALIPGVTAARQTTWTVDPGGAFTGSGTITIDQTTCGVNFQGSFFDSSGDGEIQTVNVTSCHGPTPLVFPDFQTPIGMTATTYLSSIDTVAGPLNGFIIRLTGSCPVTLAGEDGPNDPGRMEVLYQNESGTMWWSSGIGGGLTVWDPFRCFDKESLSVRSDFAITPLQTIRPST